MHVEIVLLQLSLVTHAHDDMPRLYTAMQIVEIHHSMHTQLPGDKPYIGVVEGIYFVVVPSNKEGL